MEISENCFLDLFLKAVLCCLQLTRRLCLGDWCEMFSLDALDNYLKHLSVWKWQVNQ